MNIGDIYIYICIVYIYIYYIYIHYIYIYYIYTHYIHTIYILYIDICKIVDNIYIFFSFNGLDWNLATKVLVVCLLPLVVCLCTKVLPGSLVLTDHIHLE